MTSFTPSLWTLTAVLLMPLMRLWCERSFALAPHKLKRADLILIVAAIGAFGALCVQAFSQWSALLLEEKIVLALHLQPVLILVYLSRFGSRSTFGGIKVSTDDTGFTPTSVVKEVEKISWEDLVLPAALKEELQAVVNILRDSKTAKRYGIEAPRGILLAGPPGTGKTSIAKVIAHTAGLSFFALKADEVISKWVGDSEKNLAKLFDTAARHAPAVIFIDEIDSIGKTRSGSQVWADNLVNQLLQLLNGITSKEGLYVIGATNRADLVDDALKRFGRLDRIIEVGLPDAEQRERLFQLYFRNVKPDRPFDLELLARVTEGKSPADIKGICNQAALNAFRREAGEKRKSYLVTSKDLESALAQYIQ